MSNVKPKQKEKRMEITNQNPRMGDPTQIQSDPTNKQKMQHTAKNKRIRKIYIEKANE